jgi:hypothetical protein
VKVKSRPVRFGLATPLTSLERLNNHDAFAKVRWTSYGGSRAVAKARSR